MAEEQPNFDHLSTPDVKRLYQQTAALKQQGFAQAQLQAQGDLGIDGEYFKDQFGNMIPGKKPPTRESRTYIDDRGYAQELEPGEKPPVAQGATQLERIVQFVNASRNDPDVAALLPVDEAAFEVTLDESGWFLRGDVNTSGVWHVIAMHDGHDNLKFSLKGDLDRDQAIAAAHSYLENQVGPKFRKLTQTDVHKIQRLAASNRDAALSLYICARLPQQWEQEFVRLGAEAEITGSTMKLLEFTASPTRNPVVEEAVYAIWYWSKPGVELTPELDAFIQKRTEDRVLTFPILDSLLQKFQTGRAINHLGPQSVAEAGPSQEDLENLSETEVEELYQKTRVERARARR
jgi:hypothetical protein